MQTVYVGNTLINDVFLGSQRMDDVIQTTMLPIDILIVASGGGGGSAGGGNNNGSGGGAGAGRYLSASFSLVQTGTTYSFTIANAGTGGNNGGDSTAFGVTCTGGGAGNGGNGGSGGGAWVANPTAAGSATNATGNYGIGYGVAGGTSGGFPSTFIGGNGGGAGGTGAGSPTPKSWLDGINYAEGGYAGRQSHTQSTLYGSGGDGADVDLSTTVGKTGVKGIIKLRYAGSGSQATGGQISFSSGYTYHTFTSSGDFTY